MSLTNPDIIIVGSGPAGVSAAFPLVRAGLKVLMVDFGNNPQNQIPCGVNYKTLRENPEIISQNIGIEKETSSSPKLRAATNQYIFSNYREKYEVETKNFILSGSLAKGGLSNAWGAGVSCFDDLDLKNSPINSADLKNSYVEIAERMGISGVANDALKEFFGEIPLQSPTQLHPNLEKLLGRVKSRDISFGRNRIAVLTEEKNNRQPCQYTGLCVWGCAYDSIYSARFDVEELQKFPNFSYRDKIFVTGVESGKIYAECGIEITAKKIILAAGTIATTKLVLDALKIYDEELSLLTSPVLGFALMMPEKIGGKIQEKTLSTGQISFVLKNALEPDKYAFASLFPSDMILASEYISHVPFSYSASRQIIRALQPSMILGNCFLSGSYSQNKIKLLPNGKLNIEGGYSPLIKEAVSDVKKRITKTMLRYGIFMLPGGFKLTRPGEDIHYAGTLGIKRSPTKKYELNENGEVSGVPGVYAVDGSALNSLPAKPHTFTIMANADRIAKNLIKNL